VHVSSDARIVRLQIRDARLVCCVGLEIGARAIVGINDEDEGEGRMGRDTVEERSFSFVG
jgi:hypothetical protein